MVNEEYKEYLQSSHWKELRKRILDRAGNCCERCGAMAEWGALQIHHRTYARLWHECDNDVEALCEKCHKEADEHRKNRVNDPVPKWADRVYGEEWERWYTYDFMKEQYEHIRSLVP